MTYDISSKYFESRHIQEFLGIDKNKLFHWVQTKRLIEPAKVGKGRGGRSQFSFTNLLDLALIKELSEFGIELNVVAIIIKGQSLVMASDEDNSKNGVVKRGRSTWEIYKENRDKYEKENLYLDICRKDKSYHYNYYYWNEQKDKKLVEGTLILEEDWNPKAILTINIFRVVHDLEKKVGMKL